MKFTSLFYHSLLLQFASTAPIISTLVSIDCSTSHGKVHLAILSLELPPSVSRIKHPHFTLPQLELLKNIDTESFDHPATPAEDTLPSVPLESNQPLSSAYFLSISNPAANPSIQKPPYENSPQASMPTGAQPHLRREESKRYWEAFRSSRSETPF